MSINDTIDEFRNQEHEGGNWMVTFADLLSLLITFFVLLFSMSTLDKNQWDDVATALSEQFVVEQEAESTMFHADFSVPKVQYELATDLDYLQAIIERKIATNTQLSQIKIESMEDRLVLSFYSDLMFEAGSADIREDYNEALFLLGGMVGNINNQITIIGHTDPSPINTPRYPSNWELSLERAANLGKMLEVAGYLYPIQVFGLADSRYAELPSSLSDAERKSLARRVDMEIRESRATR